MARAKIREDTADRLEKAARTLSDRLMERRRKLRSILGPRSFLGEPLDEGQALGQYALLRHDAAGWAEVLRKMVRVSRDGRILLPREFIAATKRYERQLRTGEAVAADEASAEEV